jgi:alkylated DNA repair protein (DNA oxidative demethylase)
MKGAWTMAVKGFQHLPGYFDRAAQRRLLGALGKVMALGPLFQPRMPRTGKPFSVEMTNCGRLGWVSDKVGGYRYQATHPQTGEPWPAMPRALLALWREVADCTTPPEACLINWYPPGAKMGLHVDRDEEDLTAPVVSVSLGDDAWFRVGGRARRDPSARYLLRSGDVVVLGGAARLCYHGIDRILPGTCDLLGKPGRINLTLRRVTKTKCGAL